MSRKVTRRRLPDLAVLRSASHRAPDAVGELRAVDERVAIALDRLDGVVAAALGGRWRRQLVPVTVSVVRRERPGPVNAGQYAVPCTLEKFEEAERIDQGYPIGAINLSGRTPIILPNDGPSMGGFINPYTVIQAAFWKLAQARPGEIFNFASVDVETAQEMAVALSATCGPDAVT